MSKTLPSVQGNIYEDDLDETVELDGDLVRELNERQNAVVSSTVTKIAPDIQAEAEAFAATDIPVEAPTTTDVVMLTDDELWDLTLKILFYCETQAGSALFEYQRAFARRMIYALISEDPATITALFARQCLPADTVIFKRNGTACQIKDDPNAWYTGHKQVYKLTTVNGMYTRATANHPFMTTEGWKRLDQIKPGDTVKILTNWDKFGTGEITSSREVFINCHRTDTVTTKITLNENLGKLLGYLTADGYSFTALQHGQSIKFTSITEAYLSEVSNLMQVEFPEISIKKYPKGKGQDLVFTANKATYRSNALRDFLWSVGEDHKFPTAIFDAPKNVIAAFLNRLYASDGYIWSDESRSELGLACGNDSVYAHYVEALLLKLGIHSVVKSEHVLKGSPGSLFYRVVVQSRVSQWRFLSVVGPIFGKEEACSRIRTTAHRKFRNQPLPAGEGIDGETLGWIQVKSIVEDGYEDVYDITYPDKGWFIANGFVVHNSGKTETVAVVVVGLIVILPIIAKMYTDPRLTVFKNGLWVGVFGPTYEQAGTLYGRMQSKLFSSHAQDILRSPDINMDLSKFRSKAIRLPNGSFVFVHSAGPGSKIESKTYHLIIMEESQDISNTKVNKSIRPMAAATAGPKIKIGTPIAIKNHFYDSCSKNGSRDRETAAEVSEALFERRRRHYEYDYTYAAAVNPKYAKSIKEEFEELGFDSDEVKLAYRLIWLVERHRFTTKETMDKCALKRGLTYTWVDPSGNAKSQFKVSAQTQSSTDYPVIISADFGKSSSSTILTAMQVWYEREFYHGKDKRYRKHILDWLEIEGDDHDKQHGQILDWISRYPSIVKFVGDATGKGDPILSRLKAELEVQGIIVVPFIFSTQSKHNGYTVLHEELESGRLTFPFAKETQTRRVMRFYQQMLDLGQTWKGSYRVCEKPADDPKAKDDYPDSLMMCVHGADIDKSSRMTTTVNPWTVERRKSIVEQQRDRSLYGRVKHEQSDTLGAYAK